MRERVSLLALLGLALLVRLPGLSESLWYDEVYHTKAYFHDPDKLRLLLSWEDVHPPLYALLLLGWTRLFGDGEVAVRLPSLLFSLACVLVVWKLAKSWLGSRRAWLVTLMLSLSPVHIWYSHESKVNMLVVLLGTAAVGLFWWASETGRAAHWMMAVVTLLAGLYTHAYALPVAVAIFWWLAWRAVSTPALRRPLLASGLAVSVAWLPTVIMKFLVRGEDLQRWYLREFTPGEMYRLLLVWLPHGNTIRTLTKYEPLAQLLAQPWPYFLVDGFLAVVLVRGLVRQFALQPGPSPGVAWSGRLTCLWFLVPLGATLAVSQVLKHSYIERNMLGMLPPFLLLLVAGASDFRVAWVSRLAQAGLVGVTLAGTVLLLFVKPDEPTVFHLKPDWQQASAYLAGQVTNLDDLEVFVSNPTNELAYYLPPARVHEIGSREELLAAEKQGWRPVGPLYLVNNHAWTGCWDEIWPVFLRDLGLRLQETREFRGLTVYKFSRQAGTGPVSAFLDLGGDAQGLLATRGFYAGESSAEGTFAWSRGPVSRIRFELEPAGSEYRLSSRGRPVAGPIQVQVSVNSTPVGRLDFERGSWQTRGLTVPREALRAGENLVELEYSHVESLSASDSRQGSLCWDWIRVEPARP